MATPLLPSRSASSRPTGEQTMQSAIELCNKLLDVQARAPAGVATIDIPMFVVVGAQSSGKSSVLDNIVGRSFLPRGSGTVTRRPLILMLKKSDDERVEFGHLPDQRFTQDADICRVIEQATLDECGPEGFSSRPITLRYYSPTVTDLTLVDLPGVIQTAAETMAADAPERIRQMVYEFAKKQNAILLAVTPATEDLVNSMAVRIARDCDQKQERTLGVITKLDLLDPGTDVAAALRGEDPKAPKLRLGYVGVINRGQREVNNGMDLTGARKREKDWFLQPENEAYRKGTPRLGTEALMETSSQVLEEHVVRCLPSIREAIDREKKRAEAQKKELEARCDPKDRLRRLRKAVAEAKSEFSAALTPGAVYSVTGGALDGELDEEQGLRGKAVGKAGMQLKELFIAMVHNMRKKIPNYSPKRVCSDELFGVQDSLGDIAPVVRDRIEHLLPGLQPVIAQTVKDSFAILSDVIAEIELDSLYDCPKDKLRRQCVYPALEAELKGQCSAFLRDSKKLVDRLCADLLQMESGYLNFSHPNFVARPEVRNEFNHLMELHAKRLNKGSPPCIEDLVVAEESCWKFSKKKGCRQWRHLVLLQDGTLFWYALREQGTMGNEAKGRCQLTQCVVTRDEDSKMLCIQDTSKGKDRYFEFSDRQEAAHWEGLCRSTGGGSACYDSLPDAVDAPVGSLPVNTSNGSFYEGASDQSWVLDKPLRERESAATRAELAEMQWQQRMYYYRFIYMLESYMAIVQEQLSDKIPKAITAQLINSTRTNIDVKLGFLDNYEAVEKYMGEGSDLQQRYEKCKAEYETFLEFEKVLLELGSSARR